MPSITQPRHSYQNDKRTANCICRGLKIARGVPYAGLGDPSRFVERATHPAAAGLNGQKSSAPYVVLKNRTFSVFERLKVSAINSSFVRSSIEKLRARRRSNVFRESPTNVFRGSMPTRSFTPKTSPLASKPANLVKRCEDSSVRIVLNMKLRVAFEKVAGVLNVALPVKRWRASSALKARSAWRFFVS